MDMRIPPGIPMCGFDPSSAATMVQHISNAMAAADPTHAADYRANTTTYLQSLTRVQDETLGLCSSCRIAPSSSITRFWPYFARRYELRIAGTILTQPGGEPSARHLQALIETIRRDHIRVIISEVQLNQKVPQPRTGKLGHRSPS